ncbi:MAG: ABC transporter permease [Bacteroidales bacterium]|jgi:ABC-2 type transport system permease protein
MKYTYFAGRNSKEILRDPFSMILAGVLPVIFIVLFSVISRNVPMEVFQPVNIVPGLTIFGFTFITMFLGLLIAKDKSSSFLTRLFVSPLKPWDFIMGYFVPVLPMAIIIAVSCLLTGLFVGVPLSVKLLYTFFSFIPFVLFSGFLGIFLGTVCRETQVLAVGNIYVIASPLLGGAWMDLNILGETLKKITDFNGFLTLFSCHRSFPYCIVGPPGSCLDSPGSCLSVCPCIFYSGGILFLQKNEIR